MAAGLAWLPLAAWARAIQERLYKLGAYHVAADAAAAAPAADGNTDDSDADADGRGGPGPAAGAAAANSSGPGPDPAGDDNDDDDDGPAPAPRPGSAECVEAVSLMREYLQCCLQPGKYVSMPNPLADEDDPILCIHVLALDLKCITASVCSPIGQSSASHQSLDVTFQQLERSLNFESDAASLTGPFDVFIFSDEFPCSLDFGAYTAADRPKFLEWQPAPCDIEGFAARLQHPQILRPPSDVDLMSRKCPTLCILDHLTEQGWVGGRHIMIHTAGDADNVYDARKSFTRKPYLQCILVLPVLFNAGIDALPSARPATFYDYILRFKKLPPRDKSMKDLRKDINNAGDATDDIGPRLPILKPGAFVDAIDDEIAIDEPLPPPPPAIVGVDVRSDTAPPADVEVDAPTDDGPCTGNEHSESDSEIAKSADEGEAAARGVAVPHDEDWPATLQGLTLIQAAGSSGGAGAHAPRLGVRCLCCDFYKSRSVTLLVSSFGRKAPLYFLGAWLERMGTPDHRSYVPSRSDIERYAAANP